MFQHNLITGIDEVGYGCWAGDLYFCAVQFIKPLNFEVFDSKKINEKKRNELFLKLQDYCFYEIEIGSIEKINQFGLAFTYKETLKNLISKIKGKIYIDGKKRKDFESVNFIIKGDSLIPEISAASIIAKVLRDNNITKLSTEFPNYELHKHKGYGTKLHMQKIKEFGLSKIHRINYNLKKYII